MAVLTWHNAGQKKYERGVSKAALYTFDPETNAHKPGVAWNGITNVTEAPSGAEPTDLYADNVKYATFRSAEEFGLTIEAYTYPEEFEPCDGIASPAEGVVISQQTRARFALAYRTELGTDQNENAGYKIHLAYGLTASPSEKAYPTINDSPEAVTFSWECTSTPVSVSVLPNARPTSLVTLDSTKIEASVMALLENKLYGSAAAEPTLLLPDEILALIQADPEGGGTSE
jgi:hypothetical protein